MLVSGFKGRIMKIYGDYHTHTRYSDGFITVRENLDAASNAGMLEIGITDHGYNSPDFGSLNKAKMLKQKAEIESLRQDYPNMQIYRGVEANIIGSDGTIDLSPEDYKDFDYIIAGFHAPTKPKNFKSFRQLYINSYFSFIGTTKRAIERNTHAYIEMVKNYPIAIISHINHLTKVDALEVAKCCADYGTFIELNAKHIELSYEVFEKILATDVTLIANSDGHYADQIGRFDKIFKYIENYPEAEKKIINAKPDKINFRTYNS